ncbi:Oxidoreductase AflY [Madurella fahalii]|uniref:Oxidoreductase AflY n=1 Tax=Madurella fahalii TaxID=1157608 RepID=A0ABQ0G4X5_9PEZI
MSVLIGPVLLPAMKKNGHQQLDVKTIQLFPSSTPGYTHAPGLTEESAKRASELLTINHDLYHTRFNGGLHNHIVHHLLALWALGASPEEIQAMWEYNISYQAPLEPVVSDVIDLRDPVRFKECLGKDECYYDFLRFFEDEITEKGVPAVVKEYVFKGDERADDIFCRMFTDLVHPIIHLGCALEFNQPSLVAEALAAACVHGTWPKQVLLPTEEYIRSRSPAALPPPTPLLDILHSLAQDPAISSGVKHSDPFNKIPDGLLRRVSGEQFAPYLARFRIDTPATPDELQRRMAEMMHTCAYMTGAAQRPGKREAIDFVLLHTVTLFVFYPAFMALDWLSDGDKARLLEATARIDAVMYAGCGCPPLYPQRVTDYMPKRAGDGWEDLFHRAVVYKDEGHVAKLVRAMFSLEQLGEPAPGFPIAKKDFVKIAHMAVDSVERAFEPDGHHRMPEAVAQAMTKRVGQGGEMVTKNQMRWVFYGGLDKSWDWVPDVDE